MGDACGFSRKQADGSDRLSTSRGTLSTYPLPLPAPPGSGGSNTGPSSTRALRAHACLPHWMSPRAPGLFTVHTDPLLKPWVWCRRLLESGGSGRAAAGHLPPGLAPRASLHEFSESGVGVGEGNTCTRSSMLSDSALLCSWALVSFNSRCTRDRGGGRGSARRLSVLRVQRAETNIRPHLHTELVCWCSKERSYLHDG